MCGGLDEAVRTSLERKISDGLLAARSSHPIVKTHRPKAARRNTTPYHHPQENQAERHSLPVTLSRRK